MAAKWACCRSGDCCTQPRAVTLTLAEAEALHARRPEVGMWLSLRPDGLLDLKAQPCPFYDRGCTVYDVRPLNCRRYLCFRDPGEPFEDTDIPQKVLTRRDLRRQYQVNQRRAHRDWGHRMGWSE